MLHCLLQWTLLDSTRKRCEFVSEIVDALVLKNVDVLWARAENAARNPELREVLFTPQFEKCC